MEFERKIGSLVIRFDETDDKCPRVGAWIAWDDIVWLGLVINLGVKRLSFWLKRGKGK